ncbi:MAG: hypothetical protein Q8L72_12575 [Moraxellaceae bacterium]|nr:hypothetical protein [Moraxellaceae bacterium]
MMWPISVSGKRQFIAPVQSVRQDGWLAGFLFYCPCSIFILNKCTMQDIVASLGESMNADDFSYAVAAQKETTLSSVNSARKNSMTIVDTSELQSPFAEDDEWEGFYEDGDGWEEF